MANTGCASSISFFNAVVIILAAFVLLAPAVLALPSLPTSVLHSLTTYSPFLIPSLSVEHSRRTPVLTLMAAFSPVVISGYTLLAIVTSYTLVRLFHFLKSRLPSPTARATLPQPVSAGRTSSLSLYSPFALLRSRQRAASIKPSPARSRWSPLVSILRRLSRRPTLPLHMASSDADHLLPTTMPDSPSANTHSLIDFPITSNTSTRASIETTKPRSLNVDKPTRPLSKASSMEALTAYRPLTPVPVTVPLPVHITSSSLASTPPPPSPTLLLANGMTDSDIPLIPITPPKRRYTPSADLSFSNTTTSSGWSSTPLMNGKWPAISPSPVPIDRSMVMPRASSPSPSPTRGTPNNTSTTPFLSSRNNLSSLSLSPRMPQQRRSKSLGGVAVKKISPPSFTFGGVVSQGEEVYEDERGCVGGEGEPHARGVVGVFGPGLVTADERLEGGLDSTTLVSSSTRSPKFLLNFSSSPVSSSSSSSSSPSPLLSSSSLNGCSTHSALISPAPLTANSYSPPPTAPLETPRSISEASYSSDIAKTAENEPLLSYLMPTVDIDFDAGRAEMDADNTLSAGYDCDRKNAWGSEVVASTDVASVLRDFDDYDDAVQVMHVGLPGDVRLVAEEAYSSKSVPERSSTDAWGLNEDMEALGDVWEGETKHESVLRGLSMDIELFEPEEVAEIQAVTLVERLNHAIDVELAVSSQDHPDPDLLPLPDDDKAFPTTISINTEDAIITSHKSSGCDSVTSLATPISLGQTPTPPASPPREARNLRKASMSLPDQTMNASSVVVTSPVAEFAPVSVAVEKPEEGQVFDEAPPVRIENHGDSAFLTSPWPTEEREVIEIQTFLGGPLVSSPASMTFDLPVPSDDGDCEYKINIETEGDEEDDVELEVQVVPPSPCVRMSAWEYGSDEEEDLSRDEQMLELGLTVPSSDDEAEGGCCEENIDKGVHVEQEDDIPVLSQPSHGTGPDAESDAEDDDSRHCSTEHEEFQHVDQRRNLKEASSVDLYDLSTPTQDPEVSLDSPPVPAPEQPISSSIPEVEPQEQSPSTPPSAVVSAPSIIQLSHSLPGTFPETAVTLSPSVSKAEPTPVRTETTLSSPQPEIRKCTHVRSSLEEAIACTRSPLEVALAMQLRPGLGSSADPAWMVRFIMVMWGWVFGMALVPTPGV
ncbi:hypothetical protein NP233_g5931 [Leucocoprinus birnbaumii]|uniref:Uncharacterized protein n=1 Tax=Leucocoprinus birnbaumii TaxID=56174 RepID=A0AAD5YQH0_9AGAR|nr:hypothetical protein NP233_g5931 [Leucocoprinus birnbaumii]